MESVWRQEYPKTIRSNTVHYWPLFCLVTLEVQIVHTSALIPVLGEANQSWVLQQYTALSKLSYLIWCASKPWGRVINFHQWTYYYTQWHCSTTLEFDISLLTRFIGFLYRGNVGFVYAQSAQIETYRERQPAEMRSVLLIQCLKKTHLVCSFHICLGR